MRIIAFLRFFESRKSRLAVRVVFVALLPLFLGGWTCTAIVNWDNCPDPAFRPRILSLYPDTISAHSQLVVLTVNGNNFDSQSRILWNGSPLETTFIDSHHLQTTITQQSLELFGASPGANVLISVASHESDTCWNDGTSGIFILVVN